MMHVSSVVCFFLSEIIKNVLFLEGDEIIKVVYANSSTVPEYQQAVIDGTLSIAKYEKFIGKFPQELLEGFSFFCFCFFCKH